MSDTNEKTEKKGAQQDGQTGSGGNTYAQALGLATDRVNSEVAGAAAGSNFKVEATASLSTTVTKDSRARSEAVSVSVSARLTSSEEDAEDTGCSTCGRDCTCTGN